MCDICLCVKRLKYLSFNIDNFLSHIYTSQDPITFERNFRFKFSRFLLQIEFHYFNRKIQTLLHLIHNRMSIYEISIFMKTHKMINELLIVK